MEIDGEPDVIEMPDKMLKSSWSALVWEQSRGRCASCGETRNLHVVLNIPEEAGGQFLPGNGIVLCRACEFAKNASSTKGSKNAARLVNFWVSGQFYEQMAHLKASLKTSHSATIRFLMASLVESPDSYEDLAQYQDVGTIQVKMNVWVDPVVYAKFKDVVELKGLTVTDALKGLMLMYSATLSERASTLEVSHV